MGPVAIYRKDLGLVRTPQLSGEVGGRHQSGDAAAHNDDPMQLVSLFGGGHRSHFSAIAEASARRQARCELTVLPADEIGLAVLRKS